MQRYREDGIRFVIHRNSSSRPANKTSDKLNRQVQSLIKKKSFDLILVHLGEMLESNHNIFIKRETLSRWAHEIHHDKRAKRRRSQIRKRRERKE